MASAESKITIADLRVVANLAGLPIPDERLERLVPVVEALIRGVESLDELDLDDVEPEMIFRASWEDDDGR